MPIIVYFSYNNSEISLRKDLRQKRLSEIGQKGGTFNKRTHTNVEKFTFYVVACSRLTFTQDKRERVEVQINLYIFYNGRSSRANATYKR